MAAGKHADAAAAFDMARGQAEPRDGSALAVAAHALRLGGPEDPVLLARIAEALDLAGRHDAADETLQEALAAGPTSLAVSLAHAHIALRRGRHADAIAALERAVQQWPHSSTAARALAAQLDQRGHRERAGQVRAQLLARKRDLGQPTGEAELWVALEDGEPGVLAPATRRALAGPAAGSHALQKAAARLLDAGAPVIALEALQAVPTQGVDPTLMLEALLANGRLAAAEAWLVEHPAEALGGLLRAAKAHLRVGRPARAAELCEQRLSHDPDDSAAQLLAAQIDLAQQDAPRAAARASKLLGGNATGALARRTVALALRAGGLDALSAEVSAQ